MHYAGISRHRESLLIVDSELLGFKLWLVYWDILAFLLRHMRMMKYGVISTGIINAIGPNEWVLLFPPRVVAKRIESSVRSLLSNEQNSERSIWMYRFDRWRDQLLTPQHQGREIHTFIHTYVCRQSQIGTMVSICKLYECWIRMDIRASAVCILFVRSVLSDDNW